MADRLDGKVTIITGGASGIGEGSVRLFAEQGARVVVADIQDRPWPRAGRVARRRYLLRFHANVAMEADVRGAVEHAVERFGRLDAIFNNAGYAGVMDPIMEVDEADYDQTMDVLLKGVFFGIKHAARVMQAQGDGGSIVSTASVAGVNAGNGPSVYSVAKGAVIHLTRVAAYELRRAQHPRQLHLPGRNRDADLRQVARAQRRGRRQDGRDDGGADGFLAADRALRPSVGHRPTPRSGFPATIRRSSPGTR